MQRYKFYVIRKGGKREPGRDLICSDDTSAAALANCMVADNEAVEVWLERRMVSRISTLAHQQDTVAN